LPSLSGRSTVPHGRPSRAAGLGGNFNWLLQQDLQEFFCYRQHDDTTAPEFFEVLLRAAENESNAAAVYCDCQYSGLSTPEERLFFQQTILDRIVVRPPSYYRPSSEPNSSGKLIAACLERLKHEGNTHLLAAHELPPILQEIQCRLNEITLLERSQMRRVMHRIRQRSRMGRIIYPRSRMR
jgi:hypothetical protein